ncbi:MAG TPA: hypothetical protein VIV12_16295 [Streptosporangiaceae bacterium]
MPRSTAHPRHDSPRPSGTCWNPARSSTYPPRPGYYDLGAGYHASRIDKGKKARNHVRQLEALGFTVTLAPAA